MGSRIHREVYVRFWGEAMETCHGDMKRRCSLSLQIYNNQAVDGSTFAANGEIIETEAAIHVSNVMLVDPKTKKPTKVKIEKDSKGNKVRISKKSNEKIN